MASFNIADAMKNPALLANAMYGAGSPNATKLVAKITAKNERNAGLAALSQQLGGQASQYGFSWKGNKAADVHQRKVAELLYDKGVRSLSDVGYAKDGTTLINKATGQAIPFYKNRKMDAKGKAQIGWNAAGKGRTNYYVQKDAQGNPVFHPQWKSNAPKGVGGFLLKSAPAIVGMATGNPALAAATSAALGVAQGQKLGQIAKGAAINYAAGSVGNAAANAATKSLPMLGNAAITNAAADAIGGAAAGATGSALSGQGLKGALPGAIAGGVTSGVNSLANTASSGLQQAGVSPAIANATTNIAAGGLAPFIASGGNTNAALTGITNATAGTAGQLAGQAVNSALPPGVVSNVASGITNAGVTAGFNQWFNPVISPPQNQLGTYLASAAPRPVGGLTQTQPAAQPVTPGEYTPTGFQAPVKSLPTTGLTPVTDPAMLKKLGLG
jgi:hypothetical protein